MKELRVLIADDHALVRQGIRTVIESQEGWQVCAEASDGREALRLCEETVPDVAVLDVSMPELNGVDATRQIRKVSPSVEILILTMHEAEQLVTDVIEAGAKGYLLKSDTPRLLVAAVEALAGHKPFFTGRVSEMMLGGLLRPGEPQTGRGGGLTPREREILQLLAEGRTNKEVAVRLGISVKTVDAHRTNLMRRLNLHSVAELVRYAVRENIIEP